MVTFNGQAFDLIDDPCKGRVAVTDSWTGTVREVECDLYEAEDAYTAEPWLIWVLDGEPQAAVPASWYNEQ